MNQMMTKAEAQDVLSVGEYASQSDIRAAWRQLVFDMHPDMRNGDNDEFTRIQNAYERLRRKPQGERPVYREWDPTTDAPMQGMDAANGDMRRPARQAIKTRIEDLSPAARTLCESILRDDMDEAALDRSLTDETDSDAELDALLGHVPSSIRRKGRRVSYFVKAPLEKGQNRVAVPTALEDDRRMKAKLMTFDVAEEGAGSIEVPDHVRGSMFPGARSVRIHFEEC